MVADVIILTMAESLEYLENALGLLGRFYGVEPAGRPSFEFPIPDGLRRFYECFPDTSVFDGQDFLCSEPCPLPADWYGLELEPGLVQLAYENQAVWFLATKSLGGTDGIAYLVNDIEIIEYPSLNRYLAAFLLNQTVRNRGSKVLTEIPSLSELWIENGYSCFSEGWSKPGHFGYEAFQVSPDGQIVVGFHEEPWAVVTANVELPNWLATVAES